jgi:2-haloacid dehalogenase
MKLNRRSFMTSGFAATAVIASSRAAAAPKQGERSNIKAVAFDAFTLFDPRPIFLGCEVVAPGRGPDLANLWRTRQLEYQWLRALAGQYQDFLVTTQAALEFAAQSLEIELATSARDRLVQGFFEMRAWPDVPQALRDLRRAGKQLALLSNATEPILRSALKNSALHGALDEIISTDRIKSFKPDPRAYQLGLDLLGVAKHELLFVAFAGWDAAGAKWFGYPTFWNNRQGAVEEMLGAKTDGRGATLGDLIGFIGVG